MFIKATHIYYDGIKGRYKKSDTVFFINPNHIVKICYNPCGYIEEQNLGKILQVHTVTDNGPNALLVVSEDLELLAGINEQRVVDGHPLMEENK